MTILASKSLELIMWLYVYQSSITISIRALSLTVTLVIRELRKDLKGIILSHKDGTMTNISSSLLSALSYHPFYLIPGIYRLLTRLRLHVNQ